MPTLQAPNDWPRCQRLFEDALELPHERREAFLRAQCDDTALRERVRRLLAADEISDGLLDRSPSRPRGASGVLERFKPGDVLAERFEVVGFLAAGGMGEVYEARDLELEETVAIKTIRPSLVDDAGALARFRREVRTARKVTHAAVCRTYDLFRHDGRTRPVYFFSMEHLVGETLAQRLMRQRRLESTELLDLAAQLAEGLGAAHDAGVIHRDLKSANVFLRQADSGVAITDFGIARPAITEGATLTRDDLIVGTPAYLAPEQVLGGDVTPRSDIYAFGVLLYEMATGERPFDGNTPMATATRRLDGPPTPPDALSQDLPAGWSAAILRCLARRPADRYSDPRKVIEDLRRSLPQPSRGRAGSRPQTPAVLMLSILVLLLGALWWTHAGSRPSPGTGAHTSGAFAPADPAPAAPSVTVALRSFRPLGGSREDGWLGQALAELLALEIGAPAKVAEPDTNPDADFLVDGSYFAEPGASVEIRVDAHLRRAGSDEVDGAAATARSFTRQGSRDDLLQLVAALGGDLRSGLGLAGVTRALDGLPSTPEALRLYSEGISLAAAGNSPAALDPFRRAVALEDTSPRLWLALGKAQVDSGFWADARHSAQRALQHLDQLGERASLEVRALDAFANERWSKAESLLRSLISRSPKDERAALLWIQALVLDGRAQEAWDELERLLAGGLPETLEVRGVRSSLLRVLGRVEEARQIAEGVREASERQGTPLALQAVAYRRLGWTALAAADFDAALACGRRVEEMARGLEFPAALGDGLLLQGIAESKHVQLAKAEIRLTEALSIFRTSESHRRSRLAAHALASLQDRQGKAEASLRLYEEVVGLSRAAGDAFLSQRLAAMAGVELRQGRLESARSRLAEARRELTLEESYTAMEIQLHQVRMSLWRGQLGGASKALEGSAEAAHAAGMPDYEGAFLELEIELAQAAMQEPDFDAALGRLRVLATTGGFPTHEVREKLVLGERAWLEGPETEIEGRIQATLALTERLGHSWLRSEARRQAARWHRESGHFERALELHRREIDGENVFGRARLAARLERLETLLAAHRDEAAARELEILERAPIEIPVDRFRLERLQAQALARAGQTQAARTLLDRLHRRALRDERPAAAFEARLGLVDAGIAGRDERIAILNELAKVASAAGWTRRSRRLAERALSQGGAG